MYFTIRVCFFCCAHDVILNSIFILHKIIHKLHRRQGSDIHQKNCTISEYADYDMILPDVSKINKKNILQARKNRAERLAKLAHEEACKDGVKRKSHYTCGDSHIDIKFPYTPTREYVYRESGAE
mgnify:CR=1 FL=1